QEKWSNIRILVSLTNCQIVMARRLDQSMSKTAALVGRSRSAVVRYSGEPGEETRTNADNQDDETQETAKEETKDSPRFTGTQQSQQTSKPTLRLTTPTNTSSPTPTRPKNTPPSLFSQECRFGNHTRSSCAKVFCPPWQRCINGQCVCKLPYQCPRIGPGVCGLDGSSHLTMCHSQAHACRNKKPVFSHYSQLGPCGANFFTVRLQGINGLQVVEVTAGQDELLICALDSWNMAAANVICRQTNKNARGALALDAKKFETVAEAFSKNMQCMSVRCTGAEHSLAECVLYKPQKMSNDTSVATVTCYTEQQGNKDCHDFHCVNEKCVSWEHICDGVDDCGDNSDEMCCTGCRKDAFYCTSGVCLPRYAVRDQIRDCLGGDDELETNTDITEIHLKSDSPEEEVEKEVWSSPVEDIQKSRHHTETLQCGIPNIDYLNKAEEEIRPTRIKRVVGGEEARPTQIQWHVAVQTVPDARIYCGGVYLGGCWVLTAAHCLSQKPQAFKIKFSLWKKLSNQRTTDIVPVKNIFMHHKYNPATYENDIALIQLKELANEKICVNPNPAVRPICVPWSPLQFPDNYTCTISGWGRNKEGQSVNILRWANVSLIPNCRNFYKERFHDGMMCAGDLEGKVDSCQGDSGGPLVCQDVSGVSYVWGVVSWGEKCGEAGYPGVYTKVAHYFEWIRKITGWPAVTKYNQ
ncbi:hypothetical protein QTP86_026309, partial [Hemibagrus guttatus]